MSVAVDIIEGARMGLGVVYVIRAAADAVLARRKRRRERIIAEAGQQARANIEAAVKAVADRFRVNVAASVAAFEQHRQTCPCDECSAWRRWEAGRNN